MFTVVAPVTPKRASHSEHGNTSNTSWCLSVCRHCSHIAQTHNKAQQHTQQSSPHHMQGSKVVSFMTPSAPFEKSEFLCSGQSMFARPKLSGIYRHFLLNIPGLIDEIFCIYRSKTVNTCPKPVEDCKVGPQERLARAELRIERRLWLCELPDSPDSSDYAPAPNESDEDDFDF